MSQTAKLGNQVYVRESTDGIVVALALESFATEI